MFRKLLYSVQTEGQQIRRPLATESKEAAIAAAKQIGDGARVYSFRNPSVTVLVGVVKDGQWCPVSRH